MVSAIGYSRGSKMLDDWGHSLSLLVFPCACMGFQYSQNVHHVLSLYMW